MCQPVDGGVARHVAQLASRLPGHGIEATVVCPEGPLAGELRGKGVEVLGVEMARPPDPVADASALHALVAHLHAVEYDLVHAHSAKAGGLARVAARRADRPCVFTPHAWSFFAPRSRAGRAVARATERLLAQWTARVICVSRAEAEVGAGVVPRDRLTVVRNGIDPPPARPHRGSSDGDRVDGLPGRVVVGTLARLARQKGIGDLVRAAELVCAVDPRVGFVIGGDGPERELLAKEVRARGLEQHVRLVGEVHDPWGFYRSLDVFALPSRWEGMAYTLLEAMAAELPVVATSVGGAPEVVAEPAHGILVPPGDIGALAAAVLRYASDPGRRRVTGRRAAQRILTSFSTDQMLSGTVDVYRPVVRGVPARAELATLRG